MTTGAAQDPQQVQHLWDHNAGDPVTLCGVPHTDLPVPDARWAFCKRCRAAGREQTGGTEPLAAVASPADRAMTAPRTGFEHYLEATRLMARAEQNPRLAEPAVAAAHAHAALGLLAVALGRVE